MAKGTRKAGEFCWINILTPEPAAARDFFGNLLGWTFTDVPGMDFGNIIKVGGHDIGGLWDLNAPPTPPGLPPVIGVTVKVDSVDATAEKVKALGGRVGETMDIMDNGRMAVCFDPNGANFDLWEAKKQGGMDADSDDHGVPSWFETITTDTGRATEFYSALFGWTPEVMQMPGMEYTTFKLGGEYVAGLMKATPEMGNPPAHWATNITVKDADDSAGKAVELGGTIMVPVQDVPEVGRFGGLVSPQGVMFNVVQYIR